MNRIESPYPVIRKGKDIDMNEKIADWESEYKANLMGSVDTATYYSEASEETRNDFNILREVIRAYQFLGYLEAEEANTLIDEAANMRYTVLEELDPDNMKETVPKALEVIKL